MADVGPKHVYSLQKDAFRAADAPWDADDLPAPNHPRAISLPQQHLVPAQQRVHAIEQQNAVVSRCYRSSIVTSPHPPVLTLINASLVPTSKCCR